MRKTLLSLFLLFAGINVGWAQGGSSSPASETNGAITNVGAKLTDASNLKEKQDYLIKGVGGRSGWAFAGQTNAKVYLNGTPNQEPMTLTDKYIFQIELTDNGFKIKSKEGKYISVPNLTEDASGATVFSLTAKPNAAAGIWNLKTPASYLNMNPKNDNETDATYVITTWTDVNDVNGKWEIYPVNVPLLTYDITYNYQDGLGNTVATQTYKVLEGDPLPAVQGGASSSIFFTQPEGTVTANGTYTITPANLPFAISSINGTSDTGAKWYTMTIRGTKYPTYNASNGHVSNATSFEGVTDNTTFAFTGDPFNGFKIRNYAAGLDKALYVTDTDNEKCTFTTEGATFGLYQNTITGYQFKLIGSDATHINDIGGELGVWKSGASAADGGGIITFTDITTNLQEAFASLNAAIGTDPGYIAQESVNDIITATENILNNPAPTKAEIQTQTAAINAALTNNSMRIQPEAGKYYMIVSALSAFETRQGVKKGMYAEGYNLRWQNLNDASMAQYWTIVPTTDGKFTIQNYKNQRYIAGTAVNDESKPATLNLLAPGVYNIIVDGNTLHANGHGSGAGIQGGIVSWTGGVETASAWSIHEMPTPNWEELDNVTIQYTLNGEVKKTITGTYNTKRPDFPAIPFVTLGETTFDRDNNTATVACTYNLPFIASTDYASATWYAMDMHSSEASYVWTYDASKTANVELPVVPAAELGTGFVSDERKWAFVGNPFDGFHIYNKAAGPDMTLRKAENGNTPAIMSETNDGRNVFFLYNGINSIANSFAWKLADDNHYVNTQKQSGDDVKKLYGWTSADQGSSCRAFVQNDLSLDAFYRIKGVANNLYLTTGESNSRMPMIEAGDGAESIFYLDSNRKLLNYASGLYANNTHETGTPGAASTWSILPQANGTYTLCSDFTGGGTYLFNHNAGSDTQANRNGSLAGNNTLWIIEPVETLPVTITAAGYSTLYAPVALSLTDGVKAYSGAIEGDKLMLTETGETVPANTAVVLAAEAGTYHLNITTGGTTVEGNALSGTVATAAAPANIYTLQNQDGQVGFFPYTGTNVNGFKAYLTSEAAVKGFLFDLGITDGIESVEAATAEKDAVIYDLTGRRVQKAVKGLYIINGKKVIVK